MKRIRYCLLICLAAGLVTHAADWPQWRGTGRDGTSAETGLLQQWPAEGPSLLWAAAGLGKGYSQPVVVGTTIYTTGMVDGNGVLFALDLDGKIRWQHVYGPEWTKDFPGTRGAPTVDGDAVYLASGCGRVYCLDAATGVERWSVDVMQRFNGHPLTYGFAESLLVTANFVICTPGGPDAGVVALRKRTGETAWISKGFGEMNAYCSPLLVTRAGKSVVLTMTSLSIVALDAATGTVLWTHRHKQVYDPKAGDNIHANTPLYHDGQVFVSSGYGVTGAEMLAISARGDAVEKRWGEKQLDTHIGGDLWLGDMIIGTSHAGKWLALDAATGAVLWNVTGVGRSALAAADGLIYAYAENGTVALLRATRQGVEIVSQFKMARGTGEHWAHPVIAGGRLYLRHGDTLLTYDIRKK